jgi:hypothetical protein
MSGIHSSSNGLRVWEEKDALVCEIRNQKIIVESFESKMESDYSAREEAWLEQMKLKMNDDERKLRELRLQGGSFVVNLRGTLHLLEITKESQFTFFLITQTDDPAIPNDMSKYSMFRIQDLHELPCPKNSIRLQTDKKFEILRANTVRWVEDILYFPNPFFRRNSLSRLPLLGSPHPLFQFRWTDKSTTEFSVPEYAQELYEVIITHLDRYSISFTRQVNCLQQRWKLTKTPYDPTNTEHENMLLHLWQTAFPDIPLKDRISKQWGDLGFQGKDPATDFRGMGLLGLSCLSFFVENYHKQTREILNAHRSYPFATFGINLTHFLLKMLRMNDELNNTPSSNIQAWKSELLDFLISIDSAHAFEQTYSQIFLLFDAIWMRMSAEYMDFPKVLSTLEYELKAIFVRKAHTLEQFSTWVNQSVIAILSGEQQLPQFDAATEYADFLPPSRE